MGGIQYTGIILSGGKSLRMGQEKGLIFFKEKPLVSYSINALSNICDEIIICSNNTEYSKFGYETIQDVYVNCGPMGGLYSGLLISKNKNNIVIPCDVPFLTEDIFLKLLNHTKGNIAVVPSICDKVQPLCGFYSKDCIPVFELLLQQKKYKMLLALEELNACVVPLDNPPSVFANINTSEDLVLFANQKKT